MFVAVLCLPALLLAQQADSPDHPRRVRGEAADKNAAYGVAGLIVGAAKAVFFMLLWVGILAFKKLIVAAVAAVGVWARRVFGKTQSHEASAPQPTAA